MNTEKNLKFGIGLRREHFDYFLGQNGSKQFNFDFIEIVPENFMGFGGKPKAVLDYMSKRFPVIFHGVSMSLGGLQEFPQDYLEALEKLIDTYQPEYFSDHLSFSAHKGNHYHDLIPLPFSDEAVNHISKRIHFIQNRFKNCPFLIENPSYYLEMPGSHLKEYHFINKILDQSGCGLLLDINNVFVNSKNHNYNPYEFINNLDLSKVKQIHMAGHQNYGEIIIDTHGSPVIDEVLKLYRYTIEKSGPIPTLLEWDNNIPEPKILFEQLEQIKISLEGCL